MARGSSTDVVVVGGGAIGIACALALARRGATVSVLEANDSTGRECSYGNSGLIVPSHCIPLAAPGLMRRIPGWLRRGGAVYVKVRPSREFMGFGLRLLRSCGHDQMLLGVRTLRDMARTSQEMLEELIAGGLGAGYARRGVMNVCRTDRAFESLRREADLLAAEGFTPQILDTQAARVTEPCLRGSIAGAVYWSEDGHCDPRLLVAKLTHLALEEGVRLETDTRVTGFRRAQDGSVTAIETTRGSYESRAVVLAAGAWTAALARLAGTRIPLQPGKGYHIHIGKGAPEVRVPIIFQESVFAAVPMSGELRLAGTMEFVGFDATLARTATGRLLEEARLYLDGLEAVAGGETWCGFRPCTPDSLPIVGASRRVGNLYFATGHAMLGLTLALVTGQAITDLIADGRTAIPIAPLAPGRFGA